MARDWSDTEGVRKDILHRMAMHGINIATVPFAETLERVGDEHLWTVDIHVKVARKTEFDISTVGETLAEALRRAYLSLSHEPLPS